MDLITISLSVTKMRASPKRSNLTYSPLERLLFNNGHVLRFQHMEFVGTQFIQEPWSGLGAPGAAPSRASAPSQPTPTLPGWGAAQTVPPHWREWGSGTFHLVLAGRQQIEAVEEEGAVSGCNGHRALTCVRHKLESESEPWRAAGGKEVEATISDTET